MAAQEDGTTSSSSIRAAGPPSPLQQEGAGGSGRGRHSNIYVRGLPEGCSEERLLTLVAPYGTVQSVRIYHAQVSCPWRSRAWRAGKRGQVSGRHVTAAAHDSTHFIMMSAPLHGPDLSACRRR